MLYKQLGDSTVEKIYNVAPTKIDIEGFGSVMIRSNHVDRRAIEEMLGGIKFDQGTNFSPMPQSTPSPVSKSLAIQSNQVAEVVRCACGKPGNYWGVGLAFPDPLCNSCVRKQLNPSTPTNYVRILLYLTLIGSGVSALILIGLGVSALIYIFGG